MQLAIHLYVETNNHFISHMDLHVGRADQSAFMSVDWNIELNNTASSVLTCKDSQTNGHGRADGRTDELTDRRSLFLTYKTKGRGPRRPLPALSLSPVKHREIEYLLTFDSGRQHMRSNNILVLEILSNVKCPTGVASTYRRYIKRPHHHHYKSNIFVICICIYMLYD